MKAFTAAILQSMVMATDTYPQTEVSSTDYFNILSIDGGGIRGIIPATVIDKMETYAYTYAKSQNLLFPIY